MSFISKIKRKLPINVFRIILNLWPPLLGAGIKITSISPDFRNVTVVLKKHWYNINYVGTHFGGSIFAMTDPFYMLMLMRAIGNGYYIWDKAASIEYIKPGRNTLTSHFYLTQDIIDTVLNKTKNGEKYIFDLPVDVIDGEGVVIARAIRTLYVKKKPQKAPASS